MTGGPAKQRPAGLAHGRPAPIEGRRADAPEAGRTWTGAHQLQRTLGNRGVQRLLSAREVFAAAAAGPASPLPYRADMERSFGRDLGGARAVTGRPGLRRIGAEAASHGDTLVFAKPSPTRTEVAHELTHYVQHLGAGPGAGTSRAVSDPGDAAEREASALGPRAAAGERVEVRSGPSARIHRMLVGWEMETNVPIYEKGARADHLDGYVAQRVDYAHKNVDEALRAGLGDGFEVHVDGHTFAKRSALRLVGKGEKINIAEIISKPVGSRAALRERMKIVHKFLTQLTVARELVGEHFVMGWPTPQADLEPPTVPELVPQAAIAHALADDQKQTELFVTYTQLTFQGPADRLKRISDMDLERQLLKNSRRYETANLVDRDRMGAALGVNPEDKADAPLKQRAVDVAVQVLKDALRFLTGEYAGTVKNAVRYLIRADLRELFVGVDDAKRDRLAAYLREAILELEARDLGAVDWVNKRYFDDSLEHIRVASRPFKLIKDKPQDEKGELEHLDPGLIALVETHAVQRRSARLLPWARFTEWLAGEVHATIASTYPKQVTGPMHGMQNLGLLPESNEEKDVHDRVVFELRTPLDVDVSQEAIPDHVLNELDAVGFP